MRAITVWTSSHRYYHTPRHRWIPLKPTPISECELTAVFPCLIFCGNFVRSTESCRSIYYISRCKDSANRTKNQMYLDFSEMQPIFETCLKDNGNLSRIQIFEIISSYGLIIHSFVWGFYILFCSQSFVHFKLSEHFSGFFPWSLRVVAAYWHISAVVLRRGRNP